MSLPSGYAIWTVEIPDRMDSDQDRAAAVRELMTALVQTFQSCVDVWEKQMVSPIIEKEPLVKARLEGLSAAYNAMIDAVQESLSCDDEELLGLVQWARDGYAADAEDHLKSKILNTCNAVQCAWSSLPAIPDDADDKCAVKFCLRHLKTSLETTRAALDEYIEYRDMYDVCKELNDEVLPAVIALHATDPGQFLASYNFVRRNNFIAPDTTDVVTSDLLQRYVDLRQTYKSVQGAVMGQVLAKQIAEAGAAMIPPAVDGARGVDPLVSAAEFAAAIERPSTKCVVDFYTDWCPPCKAIAPSIEKLAQGTPAVRFYKVNAEKVECGHEITAMPTFLFFNNGVKVHTVVGADFAKIREALDNLLAM
ncbi:hypothetical protein PBRA_001087 [Plasmodiophora brassicae]|uniref:Thioredoxin domain-containing protein n=1 Tax=Plasmodiophora brassicae TaxID=37360 RepID=A0A0G4IVU0_PLABS|nr:hypothetical protein PBRA_001087 [Plasmodiophora brassicae]